MKKIIFFLLLIGVSSVCFAQGRYSASDAERLIYQGLRYFQWGDIERAGAYFEEATKADPKNSDAYYYWGVALTEMARNNKDEKTFNQALEKYEKATRLNPDNADAYNGWACALMDLGKEKKKIKSYAGKAESLLKKTEQLGEQTGAYNLACLYSLTNKKGKAMEWLNIMMSKKYKSEMNELSRTVFDKDSDFDNIRQSDEFIEFLNKTFPHELPDKFQAM